jgi:hypothetical protein
MMHALPPLTHDLVDRFWRDGYIVLDCLWQDELLTGVIARTESMYERNDGLLHHGVRIQDLWLKDAGVRDIALHPPILAALAQLFGRKPLPFQTLNFPVGTEQRAHSDTIHFNSLPHGYLAGVWVALEDVDEDNGSLVYYPGSHRLPEITMRDVGVPPGGEHYRDYEDYTERLIAERGLPVARGNLRRGQALIWHGNLIHGGGPHPNKARTRHSQVTHYFFDGCKYYTPMHSTERQLAYRNPTWVTHSNARLLLRGRDRLASAWRRLRRST